MKYNNCKTQTVNDENNEWNWDIIQSYYDKAFVKISTTPN